MLSEESSGPDADAYLALVNSGDASNTGFGGWMEYAYDTATVLGYATIHGNSSWASSVRYHTPGNPDLVTPTHTRNAHTRAPRARAHTHTHTHTHAHARTRNLASTMHHGVKVVILFASTAVHSQPTHLRARARAHTNPRRRQARALCATTQTQETTNTAKEITLLDKPWALGTR